jgi:LuxR family quorum sensing-dependent transcriptional regulator
MQACDFRTALDAIDSINSAVSVDDVQASLSCSLAALGYEHTLFALAPNPGRTTFDKLVVLQDWPQDWAAQYRLANYHPHDPIARHARTQLDPFDWSEAPPAKDPVGRQVMEISAVDYKMQRGRCIPIHDHVGYRGAISLAGRNDCESASGAADLIAMMAYNRVNRLKSASRKARLTPRECEVVNWAAAGKTAWDTSSILKVSEKTVEKHMASAMRKFDCYSKAQLVAECLRAGEIAF